MFERLIRKSTVIHISDMCESESASRLKDILDTEKHLEEGDIEFAFEATAEGSDLIIDCWWDNEMLVDEILHKLKREIYDIIGGDVYGEDTDTIEVAVGKLLMKKKCTLAAAESCTGGLISSRITNAPGSSVYFRQAFVTYSSRSKIDILGLDAGLIKETGAVSSDVASGMASRMRDISKTDYAVSITGYAGPAASTKERPGSAYIAVSGPGGVEVQKVMFSGSRSEVKDRFASSALVMLWRVLKRA